MRETCWDKFLGMMQPSETKCNKESLCYINKYLYVVQFSDSWYSSSTKCKKTNPPYACINNEVLRHRQDLLNVDRCHKSSSLIKDLQVYESKV